MTQTQTLTKTLVFPLDVQSDNESLLHDARLECRRVFNEVLRLNYDGWDWDEIEDVVEQNPDLVQNTAQRIMNKAFDALDGGVQIRMNSEAGCFLSDSCPKTHASAVLSARSS